MFTNVCIVCQQSLVALAIYHTFTCDWKCITTRLERKTKQPVYCCFTKEKRNTESTCNICLLQETYGYSAILIAIFTQ